MSVNKAILVGFVGNDPEVRYLDSGTAVANFRIATSENYTNRAGEGSVIRRNTISNNIVNNNKKGISLIVSNNNTVENCHPLQNND